MTYKVQLPACHEQIHTHHQCQPLRLLHYFRTQLPTENEEATNMLKNQENTSHILLQLI